MTCCSEKFSAADSWETEYELSIEHCNQEELLVNISEVESDNDKGADVTAVQFNIYK